MKTFLAFSYFEEHEQILGKFFVRQDKILLVTSIIYKSIAVVLTESNTFSTLALLENYS